MPFQGDPVTRNIGSYYPARMLELKSIFNDLTIEPIYLTSLVYALTGSRGFQSGDVMTLLNPYLIPKPGSAST